MKLAWLEDFLALIEAGTFSAAADRRNVTQPAFSRRVRMLEDWLGVALVDRSRHRSEPTATALRFAPEVRALVGRTYDLRSRMRADTLSRRRLTVTTQHTLMVTHLPDWLRRFQGWEPQTAFHVHTGNIEECAHQLVRGEADLMIAYEARAVDDGLAAAPGAGPRHVLGDEAMVPVATVPASALAEGGRLRVLNYPEQSFLGRVVRTHCLPPAVRRYSVEIACESAFAVGLREMCLAGLGIAWLPRGLVAREIDAGQLHVLTEALAAPALTIAARCLADNTSPALEALWGRLTADA